MKYASGSKWDRVGSAFPTPSPAIAPTFSMSCLCCASSALLWASQSKASVAGWWWDTLVEQGMYQVQLKGRRGPLKVMTMRIRADTAERFQWLGNLARYIMAVLVELLSRATLAMCTWSLPTQGGQAGQALLTLDIAITIITTGKGMKLAPSAKINNKPSLLFTSATPMDLLAML